MLEPPEESNGGDRDGSESPAPPSSLADPVSQFIGTITNLNQQKLIRDVIWIT
jgi:hypothetical protein